MIKNIALIIITSILISCYGTKHIQADEYILKKNNIIINNETSTTRIKNISKQEINTIIKQKPNKKILGLIPFHLWIYNLSDPNKKNWSHSYLRKIGEKPHVLNLELMDKSLNQIKAYFENNGYFTATVNTQIEYQKNKANVNYIIETGQSYNIKNINYTTILDQNIYELINQKHTKYALQKGDIFTYDAVNNERSEIEKLLQNNGYYKFSKDLIYVVADSTINNLIELEFKLKTNNIDSTVYKQFYTKQIFIHLNNDLNTPNDTIIQNGYHFIIQKSQKRQLNLDIISELIKIKKHLLYSKEDAENTYKNLANLLFFKKILIEFKETESINNLDCNIYLETPTKMYYSIEAEVKRSADEGNLGVSSYLQFGNNNLIRGAENLNGKIRLSLENRQTDIENDENIFNTREIFYEVGLRVPKLIIPKIINYKIKNRFQMNTNFIFSFAKRQRPDFSSNIITQKAGYNWKNSNKTQHQLNIIELSFSDIGKINSFIQNELNENPYLSEQFEDKFIPATNYIFTFNNQKIYRISNYTYLKAKAELSGNMLFMIAPIVNLNQNENGHYMIFNNPFSQYLRIDIDMRRYLMFSKDNMLIMRGFFGMGYSYNNSDELPIQKQFFSGGVNSIRAWEAFGLGPGSITRTSLNNYSTGDIKLEFNTEYRFPLFNNIKSALFIDGGNIWSVKNDPREGSIFKINDFMSELAIGIGSGLRYDFDFFVIRLDIAVPLRNPSLPTNQRWIKNPLNQKFRYNLAIGYPF